MRSPLESKYWFRAKRHGWGWGLPMTWQGWGVLLVYVALVLGGIPLIQASKGDLVYVVYLCILTAVLVVICRLKGEPARWRWGKRDA
jgi:hypothetical protein